MAVAKYLTEFIGTFFLVLTVGLTVTQGVAMAPLAIGCSLMIMVYMGGHISGAHYNPAVSLAAALRGALNVFDLVPYIIAQIAGALIAAFVVSIVIPGGDNGANYFPLAPGEDFGGVFGLAPWLIEILFTFALCLVVLNCATSSATSGNSFFGLAIGFTIVVAAFAGGPISGGAFNPAVGIGPNVIAATLGGKPEVLQNILLYAGAPLTGGVLAAIVFKIQEAFVEAKATS